MPMTPRMDMLSPDVSPLKSSGQAQEVSSTSHAGDSFAAMLGKMVTDVSAQQNTAMQSVQAIQGGQNVPLHQAIISMEEANTSFQLMVEVRNRLLESYQEIMRMQI